MKIRLKTLEALKDHPDWEIKGEYLRHKNCNYSIDIKSLSVFNKTLGTIVDKLNSREYILGRRGRISGFETQQYTYLDSMIEEIIPE